MTYNAEELKNKLPRLEVFDLYNDGEAQTVAPHSFIRDGLLHVSAEEGDDAADYYGEFRGGYPWINPTLENFAKENGCYWEWDNPGCIVLVH